MTEKRDRVKNFNVRLRPDELAKLRALARDRDLDASTFVRHFVRDEYTRRFGNAAPESLETER
jgi:hypothetical protein